MSKEVTMEKIVALAKNRGFVFPGSEIYGGLANTWDYGPLGVEFKNNVKKAWWKKFVQESKYNVGLDAAILMNPRTWEASGHVGGFADPLIDCKECKSRFRADKLIEEYMQENGMEVLPVDGWSNEKLEGYIAEKGIKCPDCGKSNFTGIRQFNLMFRERQERKFRLVSPRLVNPSVTRLRRVTLHSGPESLSRWNWNSSVSREPIWSGLTIGSNTALTSSNL